MGVFRDVVPDIKIASPPVSSCDKSDSTSTMFQAIDDLVLSWVFVDDATGSMLSWHTTDAPKPLLWNISHVFTTEAKSILFRLLHPSESLSILPLHQLRSTSDTLFHSAHGLDITFIPHCNGKVVEWARELSIIISFISISSMPPVEFALMSLILHRASILYSTGILPRCLYY